MLRGLVEQQHRWLLRQRLADLDHEAPVGPEVADGQGGIDRAVALPPSHGLPGPTRGGVPPARTALLRRPERHVLANGQVGEQRRLLVDDRKPELGRSLGRRVFQFDTVDEDAALVGLERPAADSHQSRLAGAILADERVDLTRQDVQRHFAERAYSGESPCHVDELQGRARIAPVLGLRRRLPNGRRARGVCRRRVRGDRLSCAERRLAAHKRASPIEQTGAEPVGGHRSSVRSAHCATSGGVIDV